MTDFRDRILNCIPSRNTEQDWQYEDAVAAEALSVSEAVPQSKDLREDWWAIDDQGNTGSCVGWATANSVLRWHFVAAQRIQQDELLATRYLWMASKETDVFSSRPTTFIEKAGTSLKAASTSLGSSASFLNPSYPSLHPISSRAVQRLSMPSPLA